MAATRKRYEFIGRLGKGTFGVVEKVQILSDGQYFACKIVKQELQKIGRESE